MKPISEEARQLLAAGQRDRTAFRVLRRDAESPVEIILFHAQQALEKFMKTALIMEGIVFRRTHSFQWSAGYPSHYPKRSLHNRSGKTDEWCAFRRQFLQASDRDC